MVASKSFDFQDPYAVEGEKRAHRFADIYNTKCHGDSGALDQCVIFWNAKHGLSRENFDLFCALVGLAIMSARFQATDLLAERYHRLRQVLDTGLESFAILNLLGTHNFQSIVHNAEVRAGMSTDEIPEDITENRSGVSYLTLCTEQT
jgi:hypothetical protein